MFSIKRKPEDIIQRVEMDSVTEYLHQKLQEKRHTVQVKLLFPGFQLLIRYMFFGCVEKVFVRNDDGLFKLNILLMESQKLIVLENNIATGIGNDPLVQGN